MPYQTMEFEDSELGLTAGSALADEATEAEKSGWRPVLMTWVPATLDGTKKARLCVLFHKGGDE